MQSQPLLVKPYSAYEDQDATIVNLSVLFTTAFALTFVFWQTVAYIPFIIASGTAAIIKIALESLREGEHFWPKADKYDRFVSARMYGHILLIVAVVVLTSLLTVGTWQDEWSQGTVPRAWNITLYVVLAVYVFTIMPSIVALSNSKLWSEKNNESRRRISILVILEVITAGFAFPLIYGLSDIIDDSNDTEWRHIAASLVFTRAVVHFIVFWYVNKWDPDAPLENDSTLGSICEGIGMLIIYVVVIRRLHENKLLTTMQWVTPKDIASIVAAFLCLYASNLILVKNSKWVSKDCQKTLSSAGIISLLVVIIVIMFISINV